MSGAAATKRTQEKSRINSDDDELDDLDDYLDAFDSSSNTKPNKPVSSALPSSTATGTSSIPQVTNRPRNNTRVDKPPISIPGTGRKLFPPTEEEHLDPGTLSEDFSRELSEGMENLMKELAGGSGTSEEGESNASTSEFQSRIKRVMDKFKESESNLQSNASGEGANAGPESLEGLLNFLGGDLDENDEREVTDLLDGLMSQLLSKEVLYEPLKELADKLPEYLANPPKPLDPADRTRYEQQHSYIKQILETYEKPGYKDTDPMYNQSIMTLMTEMQKYGEPPAEIMGNMPPGLEGLEGGMRAGEACIIV